MLCARKVASIDEHEKLLLIKQFEGIYRERGEISTGRYAITV